MSVSGPMFDGRADQAAREAVLEAERTVATLGAAMVRNTLDLSLKTQTPYYRLQVRATREPPGHIIHDNGVIYGPWLEGTGSRNYPVTRFKGYASFRRTAQRLQARAMVIAENAVHRYIGRMN
jgi:hypothetical protein